MVRLRQAVWIPFISTLQVCESSQQQNEHAVLHIIVLDSPHHSSTSSMLIAVDCCDVVSLTADGEVVEERGDGSAVD